MAKEVKRGDIFYVYRDEKNKDKGKPAVIVSSNRGNAASPVVCVVYITGREKKEMPTVHVQIECGGICGTVMCEEPYTVSKELIGDYIGSCSTDEMDRISSGLAGALQLSDWVLKMCRRAYR